LRPPKTHLDPLRLKFGRLLGSLQPRNSEAHQSRLRCRADFHRCKPCRQAGDHSGASTPSPPGWQPHPELGSSRKCVAEKGIRPCAQSCLAALCRP
jgi:hypothetical protein